MTIEVNDGERAGRRRRRRRGETVLSSHHQITIPVAVLNEIHLRPGDRVVIEPDGEGRFVGVRSRDPLEELIGSAPGLSEATDLEALRDEWER